MSDVQREQHKQMRDRQWAEMFAGINEGGWEIIPLFENGAPGFDESIGQVQPRLALMTPHPQAKGAVIICAGGGFRYKTYTEAMYTAVALYSHGFNCAILDYRVRPYEVSDGLADALAAVRVLRGRLPGNKIAVLGYSAGGILAAACGAFFDETSRPDACVVCYGAMDFSQTYGELSYDIQKQNDAARHSAHQNLRPDSPPYYIFQTASDDPRHALKLGNALAERGVPFEMHIFKDGGHGGALYDGQEGTPNVPHTAQWLPLAEQWLHEYGFLSCLT